ncbi:MAG: PAS domain S-box protein, partial [Proteobacteria bacterium]|nr:PAS domain S-box protein [Pseudomonadota bacterium]
YLIYLRKASLLQKTEELLQTETKLRQSEAKYRLMFETTISGFALLKMIYDEEGKPVDCRYEDVNPAHEKLTGLKNREILGRTARECIPNLENHWIENYGKVDQTGEPMYVANRVEGLNRFYGVLAYRPVPGYIAVTFEDITGRKKAEEALQRKHDELEQRVVDRTEDLTRMNEELLKENTARKEVADSLQESEEKYRILFNNEIYAICIFDLETLTLLDANDAYSQIYGYSREELISGMTIHDITAEHQVSDAATQQAIREGTIFIPLRYHRKKDGTVFPVEIVGGPYNWKGRKVMFALAHDITYRKQAEEALWTQNKTFSQVLNGLDVLVYVVDMKTYEIVFINTYGQNIWGDIKGKICWQVIQTDKAGPCEYCTNSQLIGPDGNPTEGVVWEFQNTVNKRWYDCRDSAIYWHDGRIVRMKIATDITERKRAEADKEKLEALNRQLQKAESLGRMAGAIAHTFNNKLGAVIGNLDMALRKLPRGAEPIENLTAAMQAAGKAAEVSGLMLTYLGQVSYKREPLDLSETCCPNLPLLRAAMPGKVVLETDFPSPGPVISANANQIQQVLTNLVTNAWEAVGEDGGSIHLRVKMVSPAEIPAVHCYPLDWQPRENAYACLEVTDTGCAIAGKDIENLFDPFFSSKFTGRGLGLPVVLGIVRAHGGAVTVESEPGQGTTFRVFFPVSVEEILRKPHKEVQVPEMEGGGTVLLVEDEAMVRTMAKRMLTHLGFTVLEAKDGVEAVEVFRQHQNEIRCVLCDLTMPRMNGWETLTALRKLAPDVPVILASGYDKAQVMSGDHPEWPQVFLGKPYRIKELSVAISQALISRK